MSLPEDFAERVERWRERLLQLDRRNRLVNFKPESRQVILIERQTSDEIMELLESKGSRGASFDYSVATKRPALGTLPDLDEDCEKVEIIEGDLRSDCPTPELQRRLGNLRKRQDEWDAEQGLPVLHLAMGLLHWIDGDDEKTVAPLLLFPCKLWRESPRSEFRLTANGDDPEKNETLSVKLSEFDIELPEVTQESASEYFALVRKLIAKRKDWRVEDAVFLGTFPYSKLAMWRDLGILKDCGTQNEVAQVLSGLSQCAQSAGTPLAKSLAAAADDLAGGKLDDLLPIEGQFAVLPADYSQLKAVALADQGENIVLHGPPGTGKSQTIANIISTFIAKGKTVLFVSEKKAALDIVKKRLDNAELGVFCLDMHSEGGRKANVYQQLREVVEGERSIKKRDPQLASLRKQRQDLNNFARALHEIRQPLALSVYDATGSFALLREAQTWKSTYQESLKKIKAGLFRCV